MTATNNNAEQYEIVFCKRGRWLRVDCPPIPIAGPTDNGAFWHAMELARTIRNQSPTPLRTAVMRSAAEGRDQ